MAKSNVAKEEEHKEHTKLRIGKRGMAILLVVAIALVASYALLSGGGATRINTSGTATLTGAFSYFSVRSDLYALSLASKGSGFAYVYVNKLPIFMNPLLNVTLYLNNITRVNTDSGFANLGLTLESVGSNNVTVKITALDPGLQLTPDAGRINVVGAVLIKPPVVTTVSSTTTSSTTATTTTINQTAVANAEVMAALRKSNLYGLILNYSALYANTQNCTKSLYNSAYVLHYGYAPAVPNDFPNISIHVPYALYSNTTNLGNGNYLVAYSTKVADPAFNDMQAVTFNVNALAESVGSTAIKGIFAGQSYITLQAGYSKAKSIGGACGIDVP